MSASTSRDEKSPIHVAYVIRMKQNLRPELEGSESSVAADSYSNLRPELQGSSEKERSITVDSQGDKLVERKAVATAERRPTE